MEENCRVEPNNKEITAEEMETSSLVILAVSGMGCRNCATRVRNSLIQVKGVIDADVYHTIGVAEVIYNPKLTDHAALIEAVAKAGGDGRHSYNAWIYG